MDAITAAIYAQVHNPWHARIYLGTSQAIPSSAWVQVAYDTVDYDPGGITTTGASAKITIPVNGIYLVTMNMGSSTNPGDTIRCIAGIVRSATVGLGVNEYRFLDGAMGAGSVNVATSGSTIWQLTAGDTIVGQAFIGSASQSLGGGSPTGILLNSLAVAFLAPV